MKFVGCIIILQPTYLLLIFKVMRFDELFYLLIILIFAFIVIFLVFKLVRRL